MAKNPVKYYVVTAYKWADRSAHSYVVGVYDKKAMAIKQADAETEYRGGKYSCEVLECGMNIHHKGHRPKEIYISKGQGVTTTTI